MKAAFPGARPFLPARHTLASLRKAADDCRGCDLFRNATQAVFGETEAGQKRNSTPEPGGLMMVGEQPGDNEDLAGRPFVGPAGQLLDTCLAEAGIERRRVYVTNTVKHFKWEPRGKRRIHKKPNAAEIMACRPWLEVEIDLVRPGLIVCLGAVAAQSLLGPRFLVTRDHGEVQARPPLPPLMATLHPAAILRAPKPEDRHRQRATFVADLTAAAKYLKINSA